MIFFRKHFLFAALLISLVLNAANAAAHKPQVCLNMIVKNEAEIITRCLESVLPIIDTWLIVDTGSTDGTQEVIQEFMNKNNIPGKLYERDWINFEHNRNEALQLAKDKADYLLFIDADEYLDYDNDFKLPALSKDYYYIVMSHPYCEFKRVSLVRTDHKWEWKGVLHEVLTPKTWMKGGTLKSVRNIYTSNGARSKDPNKYQNDIKILENELKKDPSNTRYTFYLAQSYRDAGKSKEALNTYQKRADMGGWKEEVFYSLLQAARLKEKLKMPQKEVEEAYFQAFNSRTSRIEPLYFLMAYFNRRQEYEKAYQIALLSEKVPENHDLLFTQPWIRQYGIMFERSLSAYWTGRIEEFSSLCETLLQNKSLPDNYRIQVIKNMSFLKELAWHELPKSLK